MIPKFRISIILTLLALLYAPTSSAVLYYSYDDHNGTARVTGCSNDDGAITIPSRVSRIVDKKTRYYTVTGIGYRAFYHCTSLTSVSMPSVESIEETAFCLCTSLISVSMPSVKSIGYESFYGCSSLTSVSMPSVKSIGGDAFRGCRSLTSVSMPSVKSIGGDAFRGCTSLTSVSMPLVNSIKSYAFYGCTSLTSVSMQSVESIGSCAFCGCTSLTSVSMQSVESIESTAFFGCTSLTSVSMPSVKSIGLESFRNCTSLTSVSMPSVESIGYDSFYDCTSLTSVSMPLVNSIAAYTFYGCSSLSSVSMPSVKSIGRSSFDGCSSLTSVSMPSVKSIGETAFRDCTSLTSVSMQSVKSIEDSAFEDCSSLTSVSMPLVNSIAAYTFYGCSSLSSVSMPLVNSIEECAFDGCSSLTSVSMPSVKSIESSAFYGCTSLTSVSMPSVESIDYWAFHFCDSLFEITLPRSINKLVSGVFPNSIKTIICNATTPPFGSGVDYYQQPYVYLIVPDGCADAYRNSKYWYNFYIEENLSIAPSRDMCGAWGNIQYSSDGSGYRFPEAPYVSGMTADGYSQLVIYKELSKDIVDNPKVTFYDSNNSEFKNEAITGTVSSVQHIIDNVYGIYITAPAVSDSNNGLFNGNGYYSYSVKIEFNDNECGMCNVRIYRPGVLLIHGLNDSSNKCWNDMQRYLTSNMYSPCQVLGVDYTSSNKESFYENTHDREIVFNAVQQIYNTLLYDNGIVSSKYDLVGHSMGGILSRLYAQEVDKESVNRIITVNTPHWGSEGANSHTADFIASGLDTYYIMSHILRINDYRAYDDLRTMSPAIINLNSKNCSSIPVHAVCSYLSGLPEDSQLENILSKTAYAVSSNTFFAYLSGYLAKASMGLANDVLYKSIFKGKDSDGVVSIPSQRGGLSDHYCTIEHSPFKGPLGQESNAYHTKTTHWNETMDNVANLLRQPYSSSKFSTSGFSYSPSLFSPMPNSDVNSSLSDSPNYSDSWIDINVTLTDSIDLGYRIVQSIISYSDDIQSTLTFAILNDDEVLVSLNQDTTYFAVPETYSGDLIFDVLGMIDEDKHVGASDTIHFDSQAWPILLLSDEHDIFMCKCQRSVPGTRIIWSNGYESRDGINFSSSDDNVIRIDNGYVCAVNEGTAMLFAEYAGLSDSINVTVLDYEASTPVSAITAQQLFTVSNSDDRLNIYFRESYSGQLSIRIYDSSSSCSIYADNYVSYVAGTEHIVPLDLPSGVYVALISTKDYTLPYKFYRN